MIMPNETSFPGSRTDIDPPLIRGKTEDLWAIPFLRLNRYLNRPLAGILVRALFRTRITPNQVTLAAFAVGVAGAGFFLHGRAWSFAVGGLLAELSSIVDCADGMLARARGRSSAYGAVLDLILDRINEFFLLSAAGIGYYRYSGRPRFLVLGFLVTALYFLHITLVYLWMSYKKKGVPGEAAENRAWMMILICFFGLIKRIDLGFFVLAAVTSAFITFLIVDLFRLRKSGFPAAGDSAVKSSGRD
jgi:phosphatidylglycerophosphate synthase